MSVKKENIENDIKFLAKSKIRLTILHELQNYPGSIRDIAKRTDLNYSSVSSNISKLEDNNYIHKVEKTYYANPLTEIYYETLMDFKKSIDFIVNFNDFWSKHNISYINQESLRSIIELNDSELIESTPTDIYKTHNSIRSQIIKSTEVKAILPYVHPDYPKLIENTLKKGGKVELIINKQLFKGIMFDINNTIRKKAAKSGKLKVRIINTQIDIYLVICENSMNLGLFKNDGSYDQNRLLTSTNEKSIAWANNLYENIRDEVI